MPGARRIAPAAALALMALAPAPAGAASDADVIVTDNVYIPEDVIVQAGSTVLWEQQGNLPHSVTADDNSFDSHPACTPTIPSTCMADGDTYSRAFPEPGTFGYYCRVHGGPGGVGMSGTVRVVEPGFVFPTEVLDLRASRSGSTLTVIGAASFGGIASLEVGIDATGDSAQGYPAALGFDLTKASIGQPDPGTGDVRFILDAVDLPPTGGMPEMAWYNWAFAVLIEGEAPRGFIFRGRLTNVTRDTRIPSFYLDECEGSGGGTPCADTTQHPLDATMDGESNRITVNVPRSALEQLVGGPIAGATIRTTGEVAFPNGAAVLAVPSNSALGPTHDRVAVSGSYTVAAPEVQVGIVAAGATPAFDHTADLAADGTFRAPLDVSGLTTGSYDVWARACFGTNCDTRSIPVTL